MAQLVRDVMTKNIVAVPGSTSIVAAAEQMKSRNIGDVMVVDGNRLAGILTDRDIVVRVIAAGKDPTRSTVDQACSHDVTTVSPDDDLSDAVRLMRDRAIRRLPVTENGQPVGVLSLGDLAETLDKHSALGEISASPPNR